MLFQQQSKIEVIVRKEDTGGGDDGNRKKDTDDTTTDSTDKKKNNFFTSRFFKTNITHAYSVATQIGLLKLNYKMTGYGYKHGDASYQDLQQREWEKFNDVASIVNSFGIGLTYGSSGGPIGAIIGATLNTASTIASLSVKYDNRDRELSVKQFKQNNEIAYSRARASINFTTGRLR